MKITEKEFNAETGEESVIEREETVSEKAAREKAQLKSANEKAEAETKTAAKAVLLAKLGITADEAKLLLG
jgi:hypothetical protein